MRLPGTAFEPHGFTELLRTGLEHPLREVVVRTEELLDVFLVEAAGFRVVFESGEIPHSGEWVACDDVSSAYFWQVHH